MNKEKYIGESALNDKPGKKINLMIRDGSITTSKLADGSITTEKLADGAVSKEKLDPTIHQEITDSVTASNEATEKAKEATVKADQATAAATAAKEAADTATQLATTATTASVQATEQAKAATTKAEEVTAKANEAAQKADDSREQTEQTLGTMQEVVDKVAIKDEEGTLVETPFRYIQNEEFIFAKVDSEDKLLFGIQWDGTPKFGKTSAVEDRLQSQVTLLAERVATIMGDEDTTNVIDTMNELKKFFAEIENTETLTGILANLDNVAKNLDKTTIKDEEGNVQDTPFRVIENEEFIMAVVDSEDRLLFGIYRDSGKPYFPLNEMYHVEQNEEFFAVWLDAANHVLFGIRRDGEIIGEINAVNALKKVISQLQSDLTSLQEKVGTIDTDLKELLDVFFFQDNEEYLAVEQDAEGKILSSTNPDGSHYIHNAKSETIPTEFEHIEDTEGRTEITTDADGKVLGYRDSEGTRHEHKISANHINLSDEAAKEVNEAFKSAGIKMENPSDFSKDSHIELPIPRVAAQVRIYAPKLPTTKQDDIEAEIEYNDKDGNYFRKKVILNAQGSSSMGYYVKNMAIDIADESEIKFGDFPTQDSFHLKKYYIDAFRGQCIVGYWLMEQVYKSRPLGKQYPYEYSYSSNSTTDSFGNVKKDFFTGSKCHPDGFPIIITWINSKTNEETWMGVYAWNLKKSKEVYNCEKKKPENIILDGVVDNKTIFGGTIDWSQFEIRNPKSLIDIDGKKYDGDNPKELSDTDDYSKKVKDFLVRLSGVSAALKASNTKETFEKYFLVDPFIDYAIISEVLYNLDGFHKNWIWVTYDGNHWTPTLYDVDSIFGMFVNGTFIVPDSDNSELLTSGRCLGLENLYATEIRERYKILRNNGIFTVENIMSLFRRWTESIGYDNIKKELTIYSETPSYRNGKVNDGWQFVNYTSGSDTYNESKIYAEGDFCIYGGGYKFKALKEINGVPPVTLYDKNPICYGFYNSEYRVARWLKNRIAFLDKEFGYVV